MSFWSKIRFFKEQEFACRHTGRVDMREEFILALDELRLVYDKPIAISSGYRHMSHPIEARKSRPGTHAYGVAADIKVAYGDAHEILRLAFAQGTFTGIGVQQKGGVSGRFIHLDMGHLLDSPSVRPTVWSY